MENKKKTGLKAHGRIDRFIGGDYENESQDRFDLVIAPDFVLEDREMRFSPLVQEGLIGVMKDKWRSELAEISLSESKITFIRKYSAKKPGDNEEKEYVERYALYNNNGLWVGVFHGELENQDKGVIWLYLYMIHEDDDDAAIEALMQQADVQEK